MNAIAQYLLAGAALGALATAPAVAADAPHFNLTALHAGKVVNKTRVHDPRRVHVTYTFGVYTSIAGELGVWVPLYGTYYKWDSTICNAPKTKVKFPKKTTYGKVREGTETYSFGCPSGPTVLYGEDYKLTDPAGKGHEDCFRSVRFVKYIDNGVKYKGTLNLDVCVLIGS